MGGTGIAGVGDIEGVFVNPAEVALLRNHSFGAYYQDGYVAEGQHRNHMGLGVGDRGQNVLFPGAIHYLRIRDTGRSAEPADGELWHLTMGEQILPNLGFGLSGYRLAYRVRGERETVQWNGSAGLIWVVNRKLGVGYTMSNLARPSGRVPEGLREDLRHGVGVYADVAEIANLRLDISRREAHNPNRGFVYMAGFESMSGKFLVVRMGYRVDDSAHERHATAGIAFNGPRLKLEYSVEKNMEGTSGALHSVDLRLPF